MKLKNILFLLGLLTGSWVHAQNTPAVLEAEKAVFGSDFRVVDTLGVKGVTIKTNTVNTLNPGNDKRMITFQVAFPDSGTYDLYVHILTGPKTFDDDSYFYANSFGVKSSSSDADWIRANGLAGVGYNTSTQVVAGAGTLGSNVWKWLNMSKYKGDAPPVSFKVQKDALTQTFQIGARENGLYIDKFVFGRKGLYFTVANLDKGEAGSVIHPDNMPHGTPLAAGKAKFLGCGWDYIQSIDFPSFWNQSTPGNAGKWGSVEGTQNVMNWTVLDSTYNVAKRYNISFKEHTLIWGAQQPSWIGALDATQQRKEIEEWFAALAARYPKIDYIDVVNEPLNNAPNGMVPWGTTVKNVDYAKALGGAGTTGWDWVITSFRLARQYFPKSKLIINEYNVINNAQTTKKYLDLVKLLQAESLIDGIGEQAHAFTTYNVAASTLKANMDVLASTGLPIYLTEVDIDGATDLIQLKEMQRVFPIFWNHSSVAGITFWGYRYGVWRNDQGAYLINQDGTERPAFKWLKAYVNDTLKLTQSITVSPQSGAATIAKGGQTLQLKSGVLPANTTIPNVTWSVSLTNLATIDSKGLLTAIAKGKVTVTALAWDGSGIKGTLDVTIEENAITLAQSIAVSPQSGTAIIARGGETLQLQASVLPANTSNANVTWSVTPTNLATINSTGLLTAKSKGTVTVTASASDGSGVIGALDVTIQDNATKVNVLNESAFKVYPNPTKNGHFTIEGVEKVQQIDVLDLIGRKVASFNNSNAPSINIELDVPIGIYLIQLHEGTQTVTKQLVIQ